MASADPLVAAPATAARPQCANCGAVTHGHYCANCGQETALSLPNFRAFMRDAAGRYVALDGRLWRTLYALIARPGFLTREYFAGRRRRYIRPARLFLVLYLLLFAVIGLVQSPADLAEQVVFVQSDETGNQAAGSASTPAPTGSTTSAPAVVVKKSATSKSTADVDAKSAAGSTSPAPAGAETPGPKGVFSGDKNTIIGLDDELNLTFRINGAEAQLPEFFRKRYEHFRQLPREEKAERLYSGVLRYGSYAMIMLLPVFALLLKIAYLGGGDRHPGRPRRYAEHLVYSAHLHAFMALVILLFVLLPDWGPAKAALAVWIVYYVFRARGAVYGGRWWVGLVRSIAVAVIYFVLVSLAIVGLLAVAALVR